MKLLRYSTYTVGAILFAVAAGCVSYKPPPDIIHASNYTGESAQQHRTLPPDYKVLTVEDAVNIALANNPGYKQARLAMIQAWSVYYGNILGSFTPGVTYGWVWENKGFSTNGADNTFRNDINGNWTVFNGLQNVMGALGALASARSAEEQERNARRLLVNQVKNQYYQVLLDKATVQIQLANESFQEQMVQDTQLQFDAGAKNLADLLQFKVYRNNAQKGVIQATASYYIDRYALAALMGLTTSDIPANTSFPTLDVLDDKGYALPVEFYLDMAVNQRPDLQSSKELLKASKYALYSSWGAFSPTASVNMGWNTAGLGGNWFPTNNFARKDFGVGAGVNWTLWDGGGGGTTAGGATNNRITNVRYAQAAYDTAQEALTATWISVANNVRTAYTNLGSYIAQRKIDGATLAMQKEARDLYVDMYNAGSIDIATLNQAQLSLVTAELAYVQDVIQVATQRSNLDAACGIRE